MVNYTIILDGQIVSPSFQRRIPNQIEIPVRRSHVMADSYNVIMNIRDVEHLKARLYVKFQGEVGLDYGGVAR